MILKGNLLDAPEKIIAHGCNAQRVMGAGLALQIRKRWPACYLMYKKAAKLDLGDNIYYYNPDGKIIANCITQEFYGRDKRYVNYFAISMCLHKIIDNFPYIDKIAIPWIGCSLGGGDKNIIRELITDIEKYHSDRVEFIIYEG